MSLFEMLIQWLSECLIELVAEWLAAKQWRELRLFALWLVDKMLSDVIAWYVI